jgi:hypothetical protein
MILFGLNRFPLEKGSAKPESAQCRAPNKKPGAVSRPGAIRDDGERIADA